MKIDVDYFEYKETIAENMKLIKENHKLKEKIKKLEEEKQNGWIQKNRRKPKQETNQE